MPALSTARPTAGGTVHRPCGRVRPARRRLKAPVGWPMTVQNRPTVLRATSPIAASPPLGDAAWDARHRGLQLVLEAQAVLVVVWSMLASGSLWHGIGHAAPLIALSLVTRRTTLPRRLRACAMAAALFTISALVVHLAGGSVVAHFHYFVMLPLLALYEDRRALGVGILYVVLQHGVMGSVAPETVFGDDDEGLHPWLWAAVHGVAVLAASAALLVLWSANERVRRSDRASRRQAERYFETAGTMLVDLDAAGRVRAINRAACAVLGRTRAEVLGADWFALVLPETARDAQRAGFQAVMAAERAPAAHHDNEVLTAAGASRIVSWQTELLRDDSDAVNGLLCSGTDVTQRREDERRIAQNQRDLGSLRELAHEVASIDDARQAVVERITEITDASWSAMIEVVDAGTTLEVTAVTRNAPIAGQRLDLHGESSVAGEVIRTGRPVLVPDVTESTQASSRLRALVPDCRAIHYHPIGAGEEIVGVLVVGWTRVIGSLSEREALLTALAADEATVALRRLATLRQLEETAVTDPLTGIGNRRRWAEELPLALARAARGGQPLALALLDLDGFKQLNDRHGHEAGDRMLQAAAAAWRDALRLTDLLVRLGGDEFAILLPDCAAADTAIVAERLKAAAPCDVSVGIVVWDGIEDGDALTRRADAALYADKARSQSARLDDEARLEAVRRVTEHVPDGALDRLTELAAWMLKVPTVLVSIVDTDRQDFVGMCGLSGRAAEERGTPIEQSLCRYTVTSGHPLVVADARRDPELATTPAVEDLGVVAYAGVPLVTAEGETLGAMCAISDEPHQWTPQQLADLQSLATRAIDEIAEIAPAGAPAGT